jgi:dCTP diphosphatase
MQNMIEAIRAFCDERDWRQFHNPKDLSIALSIESAELMEKFLWKNTQEVEKIVETDREAIEDEIADVAIFLLDLVDVLHVDLEKAVLSKLEKSKLKYPIDKARGKNLKYDQLD